MSLFMIKLLISISMLIIAIIVLAIVECEDNRREMHQKGVSVKATVIDVQTKQDWREEDRWGHDELHGYIKKTWQTCYDVTVQWTHPSTGQLYTTQTRIQANDCMKKPVKGDSAMVRFDQHNPEHACLDPQSLPGPHPPEEYIETITRSISQTLNE